MYIFRITYLEQLKLLYNNVEVAMQLCRIAVFTSVFYQIFSSYQCQILITYKQLHPFYEVDFDIWITHNGALKKRDAIWWQSGSRNLNSNCAMETPEETLRREHAETIPLIF